MNEPKAPPGDGSAHPPRGAGISKALGLKTIDEVGNGTRFNGRPYVSSDGYIRIGRDSLIGSRPVQSHLVVMAGGCIVIGDRVVISYGAAMSALQAIHIGDDTRIGPYCVILDNDFHKVGDRNSPGIAAPVHIGRGVEIGARVTMLRGARIGDGARVHSGSTISGVVAAGATVTGVPARTPGPEAPRKADAAVLDIARRVFGLPLAPAAADGPGVIGQWDGHGVIRLLLALEEEFGVTLSPERMRCATNLADVSRLVTQARSAGSSRTHA